MMRKASLSCVGLVIVLAMTMIPPPATAQSQATAVHQCLHGGWQSLAQPESPTVPFTNLGEWVSYAAQGGEPVDATTVIPTVSVSITLALYDDYQTCRATFSFLNLGGPTFWLVYRSGDAEIVEQYLLTNPMQLTKTLAIGESRYAEIYPTAELTAPLVTSDVVTCMPGTGR